MNSSFSCTLYGETSSVVLCMEHRISQRILMGLKSPEDSEIETMPYEDRLEELEVFILKKRRMGRSRVSVVSSLPLRWRLASAGGFSLNSQTGAADDPFLKASLNLSCIRASLVLSSQEEAAYPTMAFRCESQLKCFFPFPVQTFRCYPLPSFSQSARSTFLPGENIVARTQQNFNDLSSSASESSSFIIPDQFLIKKIVSQVEFYFSDDNLSKDLFLLRHMQRNKMGFVSIKLLTTFKKMKCLTCNWRVILYALQFSKLLELNEDGTKVRRKEPIPKSFVNVPLNKTLLAWNVLSCEESGCSSLLLQENFLDTITKLFGPFGDIACIRIFRPGKKLPSAVKKSTSSYPELLTRWCALVEYERLKSARKAFGGLRHKQFCSPGQSIKVINLSTLKKTNVVSQEDNEKIEEIPKSFRKWPNKLSEGLEDFSPCSSSTEPDSIPVSTPIVHRNFSSPPVMSTTKPYNSSGQAFKPNSSSLSHADPLESRKPLPGPLCPSPISAPKSGTSELQKPSNSCSGNRVGPGNLGTPKRRGPPNNQPVVQNPESLGLWPPSTILCKPVVVCPTVVRLPRGPDGTRGFPNTRGRGRGFLKH